MIVPRATHLFEEPGALEEVARLARDWFVRHLTRAEHATGARGSRTAEESTNGSPLSRP